MAEKKEKWEKERCPDGTTCAIKDNLHFHVMNLDDAAKRKYLDDGWSISQFCHGKTLAMVGDPILALGLADGREVSREIDANGITFTFTATDHAGSLNKYGYPCP